jgi:hypothetical protein
VTIRIRCCDVVVVVVMISNDEKVYLAETDDCDLAP